jgi:GT2 family glycosyltransferase
MIVDDASNDSERIAATAAAHNAHYFRLHERRGAAFAKNVAIASAQSPYLLFLDSDVEFVSNTCVETMVTALAHDASLGAVGGEAICDERGYVTHVFGRHIDRESGVSYCRYIAVADLAPDAEAVCDYIPTSNCMVPTALALRLGGFDDSERDLGHDKDFGYRLGLGGFRSIVLRDSVVLHKFAATERPPNPLRVSRRTQVRFLWRHGGLKAVGQLLLRSSDIRLAYTEDLNIARHEQHYRTAVLRLGEPTVTGASARTGLLAACLWNAVRWRHVQARGSRHSATELMKSIAASYAPGRSAQC